MPAIVGVGPVVMNRKENARQVVHVSVAIPQAYLDRLREEVTQMLQIQPVLSLRGCEFLLQVWFLQLSRGAVL